MKQGKWCWLSSIWLLLILAPAITRAGWEKWYGGPDDDAGLCVKQMPDSGYIVLGSTSSFEDGPMWLLRLNRDGDSVWTKLYEASAENIYLTSDGGYMIPGERNDNLLLLKLDENGNEIWSKEYGNDTLWDEGVAALETEDGGYMVFGNTKSFATGEWDTDVWILRIDSVGDTLWTKLYGGEERDEVRCAFKGCLSSPYAMYVRAFSYDMVVGVDDTGEFVFEDTLSALGICYVNTCHDVSGDCYLITGKGGTNHDDDPSDVFLGKTNVYYPDAYDWTLYWGTDYPDMGFYVTQSWSLTGSDCVVTGMWGRSGPTDSDLFLTKVDSYFGWEFWHQTYGGDSAEFGYYVEQTLDTGYIAVGSTRSYGSGGEDIYIVKTDPDGYVDVEAERVTHHLDWHITTPIGHTITLRAPEGSAPLDLVVFDASGRQVDEIRLASGSTTWPVTQRFSPGVYFIREVSGNTTTHKVVLVR